MILLALHFKGSHSKNVTITSLITSTFIILFPYLFIFFFYSIIYFNSYFDVNHLVVWRLLCETGPQIQQMNELIIDKEGEGLILRKCGSLYEPGKSYSLLKLKVFVLFFIFIFYLFIYNVVLVYIVQYSFLFLDEY